MVSSRVATAPCRWRHSASSAPELSEFWPCCAPPLVHAPRLRPTTSSQLRFLRKAARACSGDCWPAPPPECPGRSGAPADRFGVSLLIIYRNAPIPASPPQRFVDGHQPRRWRQGGRCFWVSSELADNTCESAQPQVFLAAPSGLAIQGRHPVQLTLYSAPS